ncbi:MAG: hypothetical protein P4L51_03545 [Puia sp.]|nr:hypothetical protein [Puia sp.]
MKKLLIISGVLSWFNLIVWGFIILVGAMLALASSSIQLFIIVFLMSGILLQGYAALKLRKSIKNPGIPLGTQTPIGIRLMGSLALFIGIMLISQGIAVLQNIQEFIKGLRDMSETLYQGNTKNMNLTRAAWETGIFSIIVGLCCAANAVINFRLLRWHLFAKSNEQDPTKQDSSKQDPAA